MRRLLLATIGLLALCTGAIVAVMIAGGRLNPDWSRYFGPIDVCGNKLCALGIVVPGSTLTNNAEMILQRQADSVSIKYGGRKQFNFGNFGVSVYTGTGNSHAVLTVDSIDFLPSRTIRYRDQVLTLGVLLRRFGSPDSICVVSGYDSVYLYYPSFYAYIYLRRSAISSNDFITNRAAIMGINTNTDYSACGPLGRPSWEGLLSFGYYERKEHNMWNSKP